jgi:membrane dipeptidase
MKPDPERIHREAVIVDSHNDTIMAHKRLGISLNARTGRTQVDLPRLMEAGVNISFFAVDVTRAIKNHLRYALDAFGFLEKELEASQVEVPLITTGKELSETARKRGLGIILAIENSDAAEGSLNVLRMLFKLGVRSIGLTHNPRSLAADGVGESRTGGGLTTFGVQLVEEMNKLGMVVDLAHISEKGFWDAIDVSKRPVIVSHGNCKSLCCHRRNLTDDQIRGIADKRGVIGVTFVPGFVDEKKPTVSRLIDHIDHIVELAGVDHVGIGSDFDGGGTLLKDVTELPKITQGLLDRGYSRSDVERILGGNFLRVLSEVLPA